MRTLASNISPNSIACVGISLNTREMDSVYLSDCTRRDTRTTMDKKQEQLREDELLLAEVQSHPPLYDLSRMDYKDVGKRKETWLTIGARLGRTAEDAQHRFTHLRREYGRIRKDAKTRSGQAAQRKLESESSVWRSMAWLTPFISTREKISNIDRKCEDSESGPRNEEDTGTEETSESQSSIQPEAQPSQSVSNQCSFLSASKKRKTEDKSDNIETLLAAANSAIEAVSASEKDECSLFAKSICEGLRTLSVTRRRYAMFKMQELLFTMTMEDEL